MQGNISRNPDPCTGWKYSMAVAPLNPQIVARTETCSNTLLLIRITICHRKGRQAIKFNNEISLSNTTTSNTLLALYLSNIMFITYKFGLLKLYVIQ